MTNRKTKAAGRTKAKVPATIELTERQRAQREALRARNMERPDRPESSIVEKGTTRVIGPAAREDPHLYSVSMFEAFGTRSLPFLNDTLGNITRVMAPSRNFSVEQHDAAVAVMAAIEPRDELEATLAAQMVAANECAMRCMRTMSGAALVDQQQMYGNLANKFMRTFAMQMETLSKLRRGGEQVVKHVHVHEGGQAVVAGTINQGGGVKPNDDG